jgi:hypothetical protein
MISLNETVFMEYLSYNYIYKTNYKGNSVKYV